MVQQSSNNLYGFPQPLTQVFPAPIRAQRAPTTADISYPIGQLWVDEAGDDYYGLVDVTAGVATWNVLASSPGNVDTLTGDSGGAITPVAGNISLLGTASEITTTGTAGTITFSLPTTMVAPGTLQVTGLLTGDAGATVSGGALTLNSGTNAINVSSDASATTINVGTGAAAKTLTLGSTNTTSTTTIACGTGGVAVGTSANAHTSTFGSTNTTSATTVQSGSGALNITSTNGAMTLASGTGEIDISADAAATTVKMATGAGAKTLTLGSTNTTSTSTLQSGSGGITVAATNGAVTVTSGTGAMNISADAAATTVNLSTGAAVKTLTVGSTNTSSATTIQAGTGSITLSSGIVEKVTNVNNAASPYSVLGTDFFLAVDPTGGAVTITLPASPVTGRHIVVVDATGQSAANNITVSGNGKNISAGGSSAASKAISTAYGSLDIYYNGTIWNAA